MCIFNIRVPAHRQTEQSIFYLPESSNYGLGHRLQRLQELTKIIRPVIVTSLQHCWV